MVLSLVARWLLLASLFFGGFAYSDETSINGDFPTHPDLQMTPGALCDQPTELRYPEHIKYCARNVTNDEKAKVIAAYDSAFGYKVEQMPRQDFKIDHFIPLCMGGANTEANLWPQHKSVYVKSDPWEQQLCLQLAAGTITQADAVAKIKQWKMGL